MDKLNEYVGHALVWVAGCQDCRIRAARLLPSPVNIELAGGNAVVWAS